MEVVEEYQTKIQAIGSRRFIFGGKRKILDGKHLAQLSALAATIKKDGRLTKKQKQPLLRLVEFRKLELPSYAKKVRASSDAQKLAERRAESRIALELLKEQIKKK
jgi:hypothetical protein